MAESMTVEQKIKHMLTLAEDKSATQDERDLAAAQGERLMLKHAVERATLEGLDTSKPTEQIVVEKYFVAGTYAFEVMLGHSTVIRALGMQTYYTDYRKFGRTEYDEVTRTWGKPQKGVYVSVVGFKSDVAEALVLLRSLETQAAVAVNSWAKTAFRSYMTASDKYKARREFIEAFGSGAARRIRETRRTASEAVAGSGLVLVDRSKKVQEHYETLTLRTKADRRADSGLGRAAGYAAGKEANTGGQKGLN